MIFNKYETIFIVNGNLTKDAANAVARKYINIFCGEWSDLIKSKVDIPVHVKTLGKKKLAYEIKGHSEGWYYKIQFWSESKNIVELDRLYRIDDDILKFMTIKYSENDVPPIEINNPEIKTEQKERSKTPLGDNHYDYLFGYTDELK